MRALRKETATSGYTLVNDFPIPDPVDDEVLIKVDSVAICGSDIALYKWTAVAQVGNENGILLVSSFEIVTF